MTKLMSVDLWGHNEQERNYGRKPEMPYEVDAPEEDPGTTYIRYLDRDTTCIHKITVSEADSRQSVVIGIAYGAWADRATLSYDMIAADFPATVEFDLPVDPEPSGSESDSGSDSGSETESGSGNKTESGSESDSGSESASAPDSGSGSETESESGSAPESSSAPGSDSEGE